MGLSIFVWRSPSWAFFRYLSESRLLCFGVITAELPLPPAYLRHMFMSWMRKRRPVSIGPTARLWEIASARLLLVA